MRKTKNKLLLSAGALFVNRSNFSDLGIRKERPALNSYHAVSDKEENFPSLTGMPKRNLDFILHYLLLQQIKNSKLPSSSFPYGRHRFFLFQYHKNFQLVKRLRGYELSLIQSHYAKKKRNPE
jgi:hypothetical protein